MKTVSELFDCWDTAADMAADFDVSHWTALKWRQRGGIPSQHWPTAVTALSRKGKKLCADDLLAMHARRQAAQARASKQ